jgi:dihydrofolate reductase
MRRLLVIEYLSVDGVIQAPGHAAEDPEGGFGHGGWSAPWMDDHRRYVSGALSTMGALLLGRLTYDIWARHWPGVTDPADDIARVLNTVPKYVASRTLREGPWPKTTVLSDVPGQVAELKREPGRDIFVLGSAGLAQSLMRHGLVDEYRLMIHPLVLGTGKRLFADGAPVSKLRLAETAVTAGGLVTLTYQASGKE